MSAPSPEPLVLKGEKPTPEEESLFLWGEECQRTALTTLNDGLRQLVTLSTALLAGSAAFLVQVPMAGWARVPGVVLLLLALGAALLGATPREVWMDFNRIARLREEYQAGSAAKMAWLRWSSTLLFLALSVLAAGLLAGPAP